MALFKINRGQEDSLNNVPIHEGYAYFTEDRHNLYIDIGPNSTDRVQVNAYFAEELRNIKADGTIEYLSFDDLALAKVKNGGTGRNTLTVNAVIIGDGTNAVKMVVIDNGGVAVGDATDGLKSVSGVGAFHALVSGAPQFGTLPIAAGGTGGTTEKMARDNLQVYDKTEVNDKVTEATSIAYATTLTVANWTASGDKFIQVYSNTNLKCGKAGNVPPIITYTSNLDEYSKIESAEATINSGITFTTKEKPTADIGIIVIDVH